MNGNMNQGVKKRAGRTSAAQYKAYVEFCEANPAFKTGKLTPSMPANSLDELWGELVVVLNSIGNGPVKTPEAWKKSLAEWRSAVKKKAREKKPLSELENKLLDVIGRVVITGMPVEEMGFQVPSPPMPVDGRDEEIIFDEVLEIINSPVNLGVNAVGGEEEVAVSEPTRPISRKPHKVSSRTSAVQYRTYLQFLQKNKVHLFEAKLAKNKQIDLLLWKELTSDLNKLEGPKRFLGDWKKVFKDWENNTKKKARAIFVSHNLTGGGLPIFDSLTDLELQLLQLLSKLIVIGMPVKELAFQKQTKLKMQNLSTKIFRKGSCLYNKRWRETKLVGAVRTAQNKYQTLLYKALYNIVVAMNNVILELHSLYDALNGKKY